MLVLSIRITILNMLVIADLKNGHFISNKFDARYSDPACICTSLYPRN